MQVQLLTHAIRPARFLPSGTTNRLSLRVEIITSQVFLGDLQDDLVVGPALPPNTGTYCISRYLPHYYLYRTGFRTDATHCKTD